MGKEASAQGRELISGGVIVGRDYSVCIMYVCMCVCVGGGGGISLMHCLLGFLIWGGGLHAAPNLAKPLPWIRPCMKLFCFLNRMFEIAGWRVLCQGHPLS